MIISISETCTYSPLWNGNRDAPDTQQVRFTYRTPTVAIKDKLNPRVFQFDATGAVTGQLEVDREKVLSELVTGISNLSYKDGSGKEHKISSVSDLFEAPAVFDALVDEVYGVLQGLLNEKVNEKN